MSLCRTWRRRVLAALAIMAACLPSALAAASDALDGLHYGRQGLPGGPLIQGESGVDVLSLLDYAPAAGPAELGVLRDGGRQSGHGIIPPRPASAQPAWRRHAAAFDPGELRPRIAVVLTGMGLSVSATRRAIESLPPEVTLSFSPYARGLEDWIALARSRGHEVLVEVAMEASHRADRLPGDQDLAAHLPLSMNLRLLAWAVGRGEGAVGVTAFVGPDFLAFRGQTLEVFTSLREQGLLLLAEPNAPAGLREAAARTGLGLLPAALELDTTLVSRRAIDRKLDDLIGAAEANGYAIALARPYPAVLERLALWLETLRGRGMALAPVTAVLRAQVPELAAQP